MSSIDIRVVMQWSLAIFLALLELTIIVLIWLGARRPGAAAKTQWAGINLELLVSEKDGAASFSRFQFLIFTFAIASASVVQLFANLSATPPLGMPEIPNSVLGLIGISGGSYLVSKGIGNTQGGTADGASGPAGAGTQDGRWVR